MEERQVLHVLVDELPDDELKAAKRFLEYLRFRSKDSLRVLLDEASLDDEPVTEEDLAAIREGLAEKARGEVVFHELAARAALLGKSMQKYLRAELERLASRPPVEKVLERIRERKAIAGTRLSPEEILAHRDANRR
jgi:predicted transcriptional regulator